MDAFTIEVLEEGAEVDLSVESSCCLAIMMTFF